MQNSSGQSSPHISRRALQAGGQPIGALMHRALAHPHLVSLAAGFVDQATLPAAETQAALQALFAAQDAGRSTLQYGTTFGHAPLREALVDRLAEADGRTRAELHLTAENCVLTAGSNQLLHLIADTLLDPGDIVLCAAPTYFVFLGVLANLGVRSVGVAADDDGLVPEALESTLERLERAGDLPRVKAIYCTSYFDNPASVSVSSARRPQLVEIAKRWSRSSHIYILEDAAYRELRYAGDDLPSLRSFDETGDTVIYAGTFSKSFAPGIRVGWGMLPRELVEPVHAQKGNLDFGSPNFAQHLMYHVLSGGHFEPHVAELRAAYTRKMTAMVRAADEHLSRNPGARWVSPRGGLYVWLTLPPEIDAGPNGTLFDRAVEHGMLYVPGEYCFPAEGPLLRNTIRLSFGVETEANIARGIKLLAEAIG